MTITLNRTKIFVIGLVIIGLVLIFNRVDYIFGSDVTTGEVVQTKMYSSQKFHANGYSYNTYSSNDFSAPIIEFLVANKSITFEGTSNMDVETGDKVQVIYKISDPTKAQVYSFVGFWLTPLLYCIVPMMLLIAIVFSFLSPSQTVVLNFDKWGKNKKQNTSPTIENKPRINN
jgi:hypothetical protein